MKETVSWPTNFLISISPDGRIESIDHFGGSAEEGDEAGKIRNLFKATVQSRSLSQEIYERAVTHLLVSVFPDGRFKSFRSSNTPLEDWDVNWHKSQYEKLMAAYLGDPDSQAISDVEIAPEDPEAEKKRRHCTKDGRSNYSRPSGIEEGLEQNQRCLPTSAGVCRLVRQCKKNSVVDRRRELRFAKLEALEDAGFIFSPVGNVWLRR